MMRIEENMLTPEIFRELFLAVGWEPPGREQVERALESSLRTFTAYDGERAAGMARLLGDGAMSFYVKDFAVLPSYQRRGVGRRLMERMEGYVRGELKDGWAVSLELISAKGAEPFYEKLGFEPRPCEWDGAGMFKMLRRQRTGQEEM